MEKPWKVVLAFLGVFVAGAVFGGFFTIGFGSRWAAQEKRETSTPELAQPVAPVAAPATAAPAATPTKAAEPRPLQRLPLPWEPKQLMRRYAERLELTPEQKEHLQPVIKRAVEDYRRIQRNTFRETSIVIDHLQEDIAKELTPEQRTKLDGMRERQRELLQRFDERREQRKALQKENATASPATEATGSTSGSTTPNK